MPPLRAPQLDIESASVDELSVGAIEVGPVHVDTIVAEAARVDLSVADIHYTGATATVTAKAKLSVSLSVPKPDGGSWTDSWHDERTDRSRLFADLEGHFSPDAIDEAGQQIHRLLAIRPELAVPNLRVAHKGHTPTLSLSATDVTLGSATLSPPAGMNGRSATLIGHTLTEVTAPGLPIPLAGFGFDRIAADGVCVPYASVDAWQVQRVTATLAGDVARDDVRVELVKNGSVRLRDLTVSLDSSSFGNLPTIGTSFHGVGVSASMTLSVAVDLTFATFSISGIGIAAGFDTLKLEGVSVPVEVVRLALSRLGLEGVSAAKVEVST